MDKFDRIYALHELLSNGKRPVPLDHIMDELECSKATAKRLIGQTRLYLDAPIEYDRSNNGYFYDHNAQHPYELPGLWFNTPELHALLTAQELLERVDPGLYGDQLKPLGDRIRTMLENGHYELCIPYGNPTQLIMDVLKYGSDVEVVRPARLRNTVKRCIAGMAEIYR